MGMEDYPISGIRNDNKFYLINESGKEVEVDISGLKENDRTILESATRTFFNINHPDEKLDNEERKYMYLNLKDPYLIDDKLTSDEVTQLDESIRKTEERFVKILKAKKLNDLEDLKKSDPNVFSVLRKEPETPEELEKVQIAIARELSKYKGVYVQMAVEALKEVLEKNEDKQSVRIAAARSLGVIGAPAASAAPALLSALTKGGDSELLASAALSLGRIGVVTDEIISALKIAAGGDKDFNLRIPAIAALGNMKGQPDKVVGFLKQMLENENKNASIRTLIFGSLGEIASRGEAVKEIVQFLVGILKTDESEEIQDAIVMSLMKIGAPAAEEAVPVFIGILKNKSEETNMETISMPSMKMRKVKTYKNIMLRKMVIIALRKMGKKAKDAIPVLEKALKDNHYECIKKDTIQETLDILKKM